VAIHLALLAENSVQRTEDSFVPPKVG